ncbi:PIR protein [Plasmodium vivax]|uniref:VIR protein n=1 Tax=Plasmodium vivax TaxID=5855 RepID=A0A564ZRM1_PLAVI|nr:PIR protein [Plasmodium vivax]
MSSSSGSPDFLELYGKSSKELFSERFYDALDMESPDLQNYEQKCNHIKVKNHEDQMIPICKKYLRFLDTSKTWIGLFSVYDVSLLLNYWLYEKLIGIYKDRTNEDITFGFTDLQFKWGYFDYSLKNEPYYQKCMPDPSKVNHEDWEKRKQLYEYYVDFDTLFGSAIGYDTLCKKYYEKIKLMSSVYKYFEGKCSTQGYSCPQIFYKFDNKNPDYKLEKLPCHKQMEQAIAAAAAAAQTKLSSSHHQSESERRSGAPSDGYGSSRNELGILDTESSPESSDIKTKVANSVLGAAPVLLTATALYRYTPLGPWIRRFGGGRTNSMNMMDTLSPYTPETGDIFSDESANYISYQPM